MKIDDQDTNEEKTKQNEETVKVSKCGCGCEVFISE